MTTILAIRTHKWDDDARRLQAALATVPGVEVVVAFHNRPRDLILPVPVVDLDEPWVRGNGLRVLPDWGWRCGDYFLYALRAAYPQARYIWLLEPDLHFTAPPAEFFGRFARVEADVLGVDPQRQPAGHRFARGLPGMDHWKSIFALTRFSGRAADRLFALRKAYCAGKVGPRFFSNDEVFCFTHAMADPELTVASMRDHAPDWLPEGSVATDPDILFDTLADRCEPGVWHPVRSRASFIGAVADRSSRAFGFYGAMRGSIAALSPEERQMIADRVGALCLSTLNELAAGQGPSATQSDRG